MSAFAPQTTTEHSRRTAAAPARTRERAAATHPPPGAHELVATRCGCGCGGSCGGGRSHDHELEGRGATRNPEGAESDDTMTLSQGEGGLAGGIIGGIVGGLPGVLIGSQIGAALASSNCAVATGPTYTPSGAIPVTTSGGRKSADFSFAATFRTDTSRSSEPRCCEVHQFIKWNKAYQDYRGGPPHSGFPSGSTYDTWYEDRDRNDKRYGHRSGTYSDPIAGCGDEYKTGTARDMARGDTYCGRDHPNGPAAMTGRWTFQLRVVDVCQGDAVRATSPDITVDW